MIETFIALFLLFSAIGLGLVFALFCTWAFLRGFNVSDTTVNDFIDWIILRRSANGKR